MSELHARALPNSRAWTPEEFESLLAKPTTIFCSERHGFALGQLIAPDCDLLLIVVDPNHQGQGRGKTLLEKFLTEIQIAGANRCILEVNAEDEKTIRFYTTAGFQETKRLKSYYARSNGSKCDASIMERRLSSD